MNKIFYMVLSVVSIVIGVYAAYNGDYSVTMASAIGALGFGFAYMEAESKEEAWGDYELVYDTANIMWANEDLAHKHTFEIAEWLHGQSYVKAVRYIRSFTNHDVEIFKGKEEGTFEWAVIRWYPYDWDGICILIYLRSDMSYIITIVDNEKHMSDMIKQLVAPPLQDEEPYKLNIDNIKPFALKWEFNDIET